MSPDLYAPVFLYAVILLTLLAGGSAGNTYKEISIPKNNLYIATGICIIFAVWLGFRPLAPEFGDTYNYARHFQLMTEGQLDEKKGEILWFNLMSFCANRYDVSIFFLLVELMYFGFTLWACQRFTPNNPLATLLFIMGAFSFYTYGINGIRNGLACSIVLVMLSYTNKRNIIIAIVLGIVAFNIHKSSALPVCMAFISLFFVKSFRWAYLFWLSSIVISILFGNSVANLFEGLGFDDRLSYLSAESEDGTFSHTGFRWDFLIYSMMPIILGYYVVIKRGIYNKTYLLLLNTYTLSNAFWVMVIRANFSNRFAYLSWFMYPLVLAYPLLKLDIWGKEQGKRLRQIMYAQVGFTWFMQTFYW